MSSFDRFRASRDEGRQVSSNKETLSDDFIFFALNSALRQAEPSSAVWERIEHQLKVSQPLRRRVFMQRFGRGLKRVSLQVGDALFSTPSWHARLDERRMQLFAQMLFCPGSNTVGLAVV